MIVRSLRLKNIKSYGEGANGLTVTFQPGLNRIAGRNGHGKTTLIEALGYGLFFAEPDFDESFRVPTYLVRAGEKQGEIDVTFEHEGKAYRVERGVGATKRRSKVIDLSDESTCAMDDAEVSAFLCRLLGFKASSQLRDLFSNLLGVKQGRLTRPFDSKPSAAKEFFEPLLDVGIFRESTARLGDSHRRFKEMLEDQANKLATLNERVRFLGGSVEKVAALEKGIESLSRETEKSRKQKEQAEKMKLSMELKQKAFDASRTRVEQAKNEQRLALQKREIDQQRLEEALEAMAVVKRTEPGYKAYVEAEARLRFLNEQQKTKSALQTERSDAVNARTQWEGKKIGAQKQARDYQGQYEKKAGQADILREQLKGKKQFEETRTEFEKGLKRTEGARLALEKLTEWSEDLPPQVETGQKLLKAILERWERIASWDTKAFEKAKAEEQRLLRAANEGNTRLAKAEQSKATLSSQLAQITGGVCPFLKEKCRQFDPKAVQSDIAEREQQIREIGKQAQELAETHGRAKQHAEQLSRAETELTHLRHSLEEKVRAFLGHQENLFPATIRRHFTVIETYLSGGRLPFHGLTLPAVENIWSGGSSRLDTTVLEGLSSNAAVFAKEALDYLRDINPKLADKITQFELEQANRLRQERDFENAARQLEQSQAEVKACARKIEELNAEVATAQQQLDQASIRISGLEEKLKTFGELEQQSRDQHVIQDKHAKDQQLYLGARPVAEKVEERKGAALRSTGEEVAAGRKVHQAAENFEAARREFDLKELEQARENASRSEIKFAMDLRELKEAQAGLKQEQEHLGQWKEACVERDRIENEIWRLQAAGHLAKMAGKVLKEAAPVVAQHLCNRIASNAQRIFNQINPDPVELEWKAEPQYSLRISPGDRRFAMLSGGEQTKLALAMTLAMIEQFSALKFAVFDEPTYGVDAESREKLADAIIHAQQAAGLDQLILVSHDNAFEGKIEHVVMLAKSAIGGTKLVEVGLLD